MIYACKRITTRSGKIRSGEERRREKSRDAFLHLDLSKRVWDRRGEEVHVENRSDESKYY